MPWSSNYYIYCIPSPRRKHVISQYKDTISFHFYIYMKFLPLIQSPVQHWICPHIPLSSFFYPFLFIFIIIHSSIFKFSLKLLASSTSVLVQLFLNNGFTECVNMSYMLLLFVDTIGYMNNNKSQGQIFKMSVFYWILVLLIVLIHNLFNKRS